jgi:hypothetical protein
VKRYFEILAKNKLKDETIARKLDWGLIRYLSVIFGFPVFVIGYLSNLIPYVVPRLACNLLIKDPRFYSSVYIGIGTVLYLFYFPVVLLIAGIIGGWIWFLLGLLVPLTGYFVLFYQEVVIERFQTFRFGLMKLRNPKQISEIELFRQEILTVLGEIKLDNMSN